MLVGFPGLTIKDPDRYALELLQEGCSDLGSRLFLRVREKLGLAYYVGAQNFLGLVPGYFAFYVGTAPEKLEEVEHELLQEAELLRDEGLTAEELARCKAKVIGQKKNRPPGPRRPRRHHGAWTNFTASATATSTPRTPITSPSRWSISKLSPPSTSTPPPPSSQPSARRCDSDDLLNRSEPDLGKARSVMFRAKLRNRNAQIMLEAFV